MFAVVVFYLRWNHRCLAITGVACVGNVAVHLNNSNSEEPEIRFYEV